MRSLQTTDGKQADRKLRDLKSGLGRTDAHMGKTTVAEVMDRYMDTFLSGGNQRQR